VREAFTRLEEEGLVERVPRRGARVAELSARALEEISTLRVVLEQLVVARVQAAWTLRAQADLQAIVDEMIGAAARHDTVRVLELDQLFHERLWKLADHQILIEVAAQMRGRTNRFFRVAATSLPPDDLRKHAESHQILLEVIASGTPEQAAAATRQHVEIAAQRIAEAGGLREAGQTAPGSS
jgi:DNA-binding GntR family transcriptional regulator